MDNKTFIILFIQDFSYYNSALYFIEINGNYFFENSTFFSLSLCFSAGNILQARNYLNNLVIPTMLIHRLMSYTYSKPITDSYDK